MYIDLLEFYINILPVQRICNPGVINTEKLCFPVFRPTNAVVCLRPVFVPDERQHHHST